MITADFMNMSSKRVVEDTPQITISSIKQFVSSRQPIVQLTLTDDYGKQSPYLVKTTTTDCHFGGNRSWFQCILCGRRAGVLYLNEDGTHLLCRYCSNLRYRSQTTGGSNRLFLRVFDAFEKEETVFDGLQRVKFWYKSKPTRRFRRFLKYRQKSNNLGQIFTQ